MSSAIFAFLHHVAAFTLFSTLVIEHVHLRDSPNVITAKKIQRADLVFGISAAVILVVGLLRVFFFEKGPTYYLHSVPFHAKLTLFILVGLLSIIPTREFLAWRKFTSEGRSPEIAAEKLQWIRTIVRIELAGVLLIILCAALMARGIGSIP